MGIGFSVARWLSGGGTAHVALGLRETAATAPFAGYREVRVKLDGRCRRVAVADTAARRATGLRGFDRLGSYAGMLFVFPADTSTRFTMAGVDVPLDVAFYSSTGVRVGSGSMRPCPHRAQGACPVYRSAGRYRVALETPHRNGSGATPAPDRLAAC